MAIAFNTYLIWMLAGVGLCILEFFVPTQFALFVTGISAILAGFLAMIFPQAVGLQIVVWLGLSVTFVYLSYRLIPKHRASVIGEATEAKTLTEIAPGEIGRVLYEGNSWKAKCEDERLAIASNQKVYVVGRRGTTLLILPENLLHS